MAGPLVVVERYRSNPEQIADGQSFTLELVLRNTGRTTARQLVLGWRGNQIVPFGTGNTRWLDDLVPGAVTVVSGRFLLTDAKLASLLHLPVELVYSDENGQLRTRSEEIALLRAGPAQPMAGATPAPQKNRQPLWWRIAFGLLGLGAEQK